MTATERNPEKVISVPAPDSPPPAPPEPPAERNTFEECPDELGQVTIVIPFDQQMTL